MKWGGGSKDYVLEGLLGPQNKPLLLERRNEVESTSLKVPLTSFQTRSMKSNGKKRIIAQIKYEEEVAKNKKMRLRYKRD